MDTNTQNKSSGTILWKDKEIKIKPVLGPSPIFEYWHLWWKLQLLKATYIQLVDAQYLIEEE